MLIIDWSSDVCSSDLGGLVHQRGDDADQGRLAGAVGAEQGMEVAGLDVERDALEGLDAVVVGLAQVAHRQRRRRGRRYARGRLRGCGHGAPGGRGGRGKSLLKASCGVRSEEPKYELPSLMRISYAVLCLKKKKKNQI